MKNLFCTTCRSRTAHRDLGDRWDCSQCGGGIDSETAELIAAEEQARAEQLANVRRLYGDEAAQLVEDGWTIDSAVDHIEGSCDIYFCTHPSHREAETLARVTGSVEATVTRERRQLDGSLVVESVETFTRPEIGGDR